MADSVFQPAEPRDPIVTGPGGLSGAEVAERVTRGEVNDAGERTSRTLAEIIRANVFTRFNAILGTMLALILVFGSPGDGLFGIVLIFNSLIGIVQELRAKWTLDQLAVLNAPIARVVRDGLVSEVPVEEIVIDDLLELRTGDQVPADGVVRMSVGLELDESLLTGEADPIVKLEGDRSLSGSFVVAGLGRIQATAIGADAYARQLATEARRFTVAKSELMAGVNAILRFVTWVILAVAPVLFWRQLQDHDVPKSVITVVAAVVGMVPEGLVLLTSIAFGVAAVSLARRNVLVQELPAVEGLARVDVVCLDKTGTLTEGAIEFGRIEPIGDHTEDEVGKVLGALAADDNRNGTLEAIAATFVDPGWTRDGSVPFNSARKWSAASFLEHGSFIIGAPEMVCIDAADPLRRQADELAAAGSRTLLLVHADGPLTGEALPAGLEPIALVLFEEQVRPDAAETLAYFRSQGVALKVISGDNPRTVGAVARRVGLDAAEPYDARDLPDDQEALADILDRYSVFGRVTPYQKRAIVGALQSRGHVVAMTGDGVNDALALKDADIGVAMGSGAAATRSVAQLVLLDGKFATLPGVVAEGRRVTANIERAANLFLTKTVYAAILAVATVVTAWPFPFLPRHLTLVGTVTIGIPGFFLALAPNSRRYVPGFVRRVLGFAIPTGAFAAIAVYVAYAIARHRGATTASARTVAIIVLLIVGLYVLTILARPLTSYRSVLVLVMIGFSVGAVLIPPAREVIDLSLPSAGLFALAIGCAAGGCIAIGLVNHWRGADATTSDEGMDAT